MAQPAIVLNLSAIWVASTVFTGARLRTFSGFSLSQTGDVVPLAAMTHRPLLCLWVVIGFAGCSAATLTPGATLLSGLHQYQGEMQRLGSSVARWPERQRAGGTLKTVITGTVGGLTEFYRLVDLDIRKREFTVTIRETSVKPDRLQEMKDELAQMNDEIAALKPVVRTQLTALRMESDPERRVEDAATRGLISLALDAFSSNGGGRGLDAPSTQVGPYVVMDLGGFSTVRTPEGRTFRCLLFGAPEEGAGIKCEPIK